MLGIEWGKATEEEKRPFREQEIRAREVYKKDMAEWKAKKAIKDEEEAKLRAQKLEQKILLAKKNTSRISDQNFPNHNNNPQEGLKSKSSESLDTWWPEANEIVDFAPLSNAENRRHIDRYSPGLVPPHQNIPFSHSYDLSVPDPRSNMPHQVQPLYANPNPYRAPSTTSTFHAHHLSPDDKTGQVASRCFDQRFIDPSPDDCSPFGSHDELDESIPIR